MQEEKPQVFISYAHGRLDEGGGEPLAKALVTTIQERGMTVWLDEGVAGESAPIVGGVNVATKIEQRIRDSTLLLLIMSPKSVRKHDGDQTDSFCLSELQLARQLRKPVVPVMASDCSQAIPMLVRQLRYIDLTGWKGGDTPLPEREVAELFASIDAAMAGRLVYQKPDIGLYRPRVNSDEDLDGGKFPFTGRSWLFEKIDTWLANEHASRALVVLAKPGIGKSAMVARLVEREMEKPKAERRLLGWHCCRSRRQETQDAFGFVQNFAAHLLASPCLPGFDEQVDGEQLRLLFQPDEGERDPITAFDRAVAPALNRMKLPKSKRCLFVVDALDEALEHNHGGPNIMNVLVQVISRLPRWLRIVATARPVEGVEDRIHGLDAIRLRHRNPHNLADIKEFVEARLATEPYQSIVRRESLSVEEARDLICDRSGGNFLVAVHSFLEMRRSGWSQKDLYNAPLSLYGRYHEFFSRAFSSTAEYDVIRPLLEVLIASREPRSAADLAKAVGFDPEYFETQVVRPLDWMLHRHKGRYQLYHQSLADWLTSRQSGKYSVSFKRGHGHLAEACWDDFENTKRSPGHLPERVQNHAVHHFVGAGQFDRAVTFASWCLENRFRLPVGFRSSLPGLIRSVSSAMDECQPDVGQKINPRDLGVMLKAGVNEIDPLLPGLRVLYRDHPHAWKQMDRELIKSSELVTRYAMGRVICEAYVRTLNPEIIEYIDELCEDDDNEIEEAGNYALRFIIAETEPEDIHKEFKQRLNDLASSRDYNDQLLVTEALLEPVLRHGLKLTELIEDRAFFAPIWDYLRVDLDEITALQVCYHGMDPPIAPDARLKGTIEERKKIEAERRSLLRKPWIKADSLQQLMKVLERHTYCDVGRLLPLLTGTPDALASLTKQQRKRVVRVLFAHPCWDVCEATASCVAQLAERISGIPEMLMELAEDPCWRVRYGSLDSSFNIRTMDGYRTLTELLHKLHCDPHSRVRGLCTEELHLWLRECPDREQGQNGRLAVHQNLAVVLRRPHEVLDKFRDIIAWWLRTANDAWQIEELYLMFRYIMENHSECRPIVDEFFSGEITPLLAVTDDWFDLEREEFVHGMDNARRNQTANMRGQPKLIEESTDGKQSAVLHKNRSDPRGVPHPEDCNPTHVRRTNRDRRLAPRRPTTTA